MTILDATDKQVEAQKYVFIFTILSFFFTYERWILSKPAGKSLGRL